MIGIGTGCFYKNIEPISRRAIALVRASGADGIELCAAHVDRIRQLESIPKKDLQEFQYKSLHVPSNIFYSNDRFTRELLMRISRIQDEFNFNRIIMHPNTIKDWRVLDDFPLPFGFENIDKDYGSEVKDLKEVLMIANGLMVLDITHAFIKDETLELAKEFYENVFNWKIDKWEGPMEYWVIDAGEDNEEGINGGLQKREEPEDQIFNYIKVSSVDEISKIIDDKGGHVITPKITVPGIGYFYMFKDTEGNKLGIMEEDESTK